ncbi:MAG TPA: hypothetical protein VFF94_04770, partial [Novosphingobium sp.]|nr:hypothetical protein [Novosphingobium sp.]
MTSIFHKARIAAVFGLIALAVPGAASAQTAWQHHHPARAEINHRVRHQEHQITRERREGKITAG